MFFQEEQGAHLDPAVGVEDDGLNGLSGSTSSTVLHHNSVAKKKRHRIPRQEKDKDPQVDKEGCYGAAVHSGILRHCSLSYNYLLVSV